MNFRTIATAAALIAIFTAGRSASAAILLQDDFESYADTAQMNAAWNNGATGVGTLDTFVGFPGKSLQHSGFTTQKRAFAPTIATDENPIVWEFDLLDNGTTNTRITGGLRDNADGGAATAILEMGRFNTVYSPETGATVDAYAIRTVFLGGPEDAGGWLTFYNPSTGNFQPRSSGWHHFRAEIGATSINWMLDIGANGFYDAFRVTPLTSGSGRAYDVARFGGPSDITSTGGPLNFDNLLVRQAETITKPWSVTVVGGPHDGVTGTGSFTYSDVSLDAQGNGFVTPSYGNLSLSLSLLGQNFDETNDTNYSFGPQVYFNNFTPSSLYYNVSETDFFNPTPINQPNVVGINAFEPLTPDGGGGFHQNIWLQTFTPPIVLDNGSLRVEVDGEKGTINLALFGGSDFYNPGAPISDWGLQVGTDVGTFAVNTTGFGGFVGIPVSVAQVGDSAVVTGTYSPLPGVEIEIRRTYSLVPGQNVLRVTTEFVNLGDDTTISYFDTFDPDQGIASLNGFETFNDVISLMQGEATVGQATSLNGLSVVMGSLDELVTVASGNPFNIGDGFTLNDFFDAPYDGNGSFADSGTHVGIRRFLAAGGSFSFTYDQAYGMTAAEARQQFIAANVPEPTAMLMMCCGFPAFVFGWRKTRST